MKIISKAIILLIFVAFLPQVQAARQEDELKFTDVKKQTEEFIGYYTSIQLTGEQEKIKKDALTAIPAPCCKEFTQYTCCCPCNQSKAIWGLSNHLITTKNYDAARLKEAVLKWIDFTHPNGYAGDSCSTGRCMQAVHKDGCGGMGKQVVYE